jgi:ABC-type bacteriocin/lantibiotic exporter with double-glycine peptidase domain
VDFFLSRYTFRQHEYNRYQAKLLSSQAMPARVIEIFALLGLFILIALYKWQGANDNTAFITVGAFMAAAYKIIPGAVKILNAGSQISTYSTSLESLMPSGENMDIRPQSVSQTGIKSIGFKDVCFRYDSQEILHHLNWEVGRGDFLGISGRSGKGKTTIINLLLGFLQPSQGEILINGKACSGPARQTYWKDISYVKQQPFLIHDSLLRNIVLDDQQPDASRLAEAARLAGLEDFIENLPGKMNYRITENGKNLSGGQRQRVALARALYKFSDLLLLDEPFSELDEQSEKILLEHLKCLAHSGKLVILIAHGRESLSHCSRIVTLDEAGR